MITIDSNEYSQAEEVVSELKDRTEIEREPMQWGDYAVKGEVSYLVERKTPSDLVQSLRQKRLWDQLKGMADVPECEPLVILEGDMAEIYKFTEFKGPTVKGIILSIAVDWDVSVITTDNAVDTAKYILGLENKANQKSDRTYSLRFVPSDLSGEERARALVEGLSGIGASKAEKLVQHFGSALEVFTAGEEELKEVSGVGKKLSKGIKDDLTYEVGE